MISKYSVLRYFFLLPFILTQSPSWSQKSFQDGFVVTSKADTIVGRLSNIHKNSHNFIDFKYLNGKDTVFTPEQLVSYEMGNQKYVLVPVPGSNNKDTTLLFAKVLVDGYASLYQTRIKTDLFTSGEEAFLCKKYNEKLYYPAGQVKNLITFFEDHPFLVNELKNHIHLYNNEPETKIQLFNHYNAWKRHHIDSLNANRLLGRVEKIKLELLISSDSTNLTPESNYELDRLSSRLSSEPNLTMTMEFVKNRKSEKNEKRVMKAVLKHLKEYEARIDELSVSIPENQGVIPTKPNGQIVYYYFR